MTALRNACSAIALPWPSGSLLARFALLCIASLAELQANRVWSMVAGRAWREHARESEVSKRAVGQAKPSQAKVGQEAEERRMLTHSLASSATLESR